ncbi:MAG: hypothetical protein RBS53_08505 [Bacteroidales bacterium]|jgi:hypothetical protein|nr:hypothetical protein [Bacteroidales bacterium]
MKTIRKNFLLLAFAAGALFLIGNNVFGSDPGESEEPIGGTITCNEFPGYNAQCWIHCPVHWHHTGEVCKWTGNQFTFCIY